MMNLKSMKKNGKAKKIGYVCAYCFVLFLFVFDCLYFWVSQKLQVFHYNKLTECFYSKHVTFFSGVYLWAYIFFILMPIVFFIFWKKKLRTVALFALLFVLHLAIGTSFVIWLESMDNDGTYDDFGDLYRYEYEQPDSNLVLCIQEVYVSGSNPEESKGHKIIYVQTGYNTLKKVRECKVGTIPGSYEVSWKYNRVQILWDEDKPDNSPYIDIYYDEWKKAGADILTEMQGFLNEQGNIPSSLFSRTLFCNSCIFKSWQLSLKE